MERILVSRQPIFNADVREIGYELLYSGNADDHAECSHGSGTAEAILNTSEISLEELVGDRLAFINVDRDLIISKHCESLPKDRVVLEIVDAIDLDDALLRRLRELKGLGYRISVGSSIGSKQFEQLLDTAHFVRLDVTGIAWTAIESSMASVRNLPLQLIAERVETREQFEHCKTLEFDYFQGQFFCEPLLVAGKPVSVSRPALKMIGTLNDPQIKINEVEKAISRDARLTYKLLRYANSAMFGLQRPVESIKFAIELIGLEKIRIWASLLLLYGFADKPRAIITTGAIRARMCEQLAKAQGSPNSDKHFLVGLFSILDAIVDQPLGAALATLPLSAVLVDAILQQKGELGEVLKCVLAYERRDWAGAHSGVKLSRETIQQAYVDAVGWSLRTLNEFSFTAENTSRKADKTSSHMG